MLNIGNKLFFHTRICGKHYVKYPISNSLMKSQALYFSVCARNFEKQIDKPDQGNNFKNEFQDLVKPLLYSRSTQEFKKEFKESAYFNIMHESD